MMDDERGRQLTRRHYLAATGVAAVAGCVENPHLGDATTQTGLRGTVDLSGSSTVFPLAQAAAEEFRRQHPEVQFNVRRTGTGGGFSNFFCKGRTDFNNASRAITGEEKTHCRNNGVDWHRLKVATDALTVIVNNQADWVDCVTVEELRQIWKPNGAQRWSDVRDEWPDEPFELYGAASTSGTFDYFTKVIVGESGSHRQDYSATENDPQIVAGVQGSQYAMGYFGFSHYYQNPDEVKALAVNDGDGCVPPSLQTAKTGRYTPLSRPLFSYVSKGALARPPVAAFARFFLEVSTDTSLVADVVGYVPNSEQVAQKQREDLDAIIQEVTG